MLDFLPQWFQIFFFSMVPWLEARYVIPFSMLQYGWGWWQAFPLAIAGNMVPIPFILLFFRYVEKFLRKFTFRTMSTDWLFARTRKKADSRIRKYQYLGLFEFVALPTPFNGAWTSALIAYFFDLKFPKSLLAIFIGLILAAIIMIIFTLYISWMLTYLSINIKG
jgi:uncharacterized membrane protein